MTRLNRNKLNRFIVQAPPGVVLTLDWLNKHDVSSKLAWWYVHSGWLERLGEKAYKKAGERVYWTGAVSALQSQLQLPIHVGAKTALQLLGKSHYVPLQGIKQVILFALPPVRIPRWLQTNKLEKVNFKIHTASLFQGDNLELGIVERTVEGVSILLSSPERAAMELLHLVPQQQSFSEAVLLIENLNQLRPTVVQTLLERCESIKVKRLFLHIAEECQHSWLADLNLKRVNLGRGKRVIGQGGQYNSKYKLSVPSTQEEQGDVS